LEPFDLDRWLAETPPPAPIVQAGAAVLRQRALEVGPFLMKTRALARLVDIMVDTIRAAPGVGLAAPQIGVPLRIFVAEDDAPRMAHQSAEARALRGRTPLPLVAIVNPRVVSVGDREATFYEGCLSVRGYGALVRRSAEVTVTGVDPDGRPLSVRLQGWPARIMQHEMDHLDGTLYVDRMIARSLASEGELPRLAALPVADLLRDLGVDAPGD
jgi:peptide deformylase